jgi:hypothetical protein
MFISEFHGIFLAQGVEPVAPRITITAAAAAAEAVAAEATTAPLKVHRPQSLASSLSFATRDGGRGGGGSSRGDGGGGGRSGRGHKDGAPSGGGGSGGGGGGQGEGGGSARSDRSVPSLGVDTAQVAAWAEAAAEAYRAEGRERLSRTGDGAMAGAGTVGGAVESLLVTGKKAGRAPRPSKRPSSSSSSARQENQSPRGQAGLSMPAWPPPPLSESIRTRAKGRGAGA